MSTYRWNVSEFAAGYDEAAQHIHPHYIEVQDVILGQLKSLADQDFVVVDAGGGSGRLVERILDKYPRARATVLDQSEAFLALAERRLSRFPGRANCVLARLQDDWLAELDDPPTAIVSMTAIHHLDADEKQTLFQRIFDALLPGGVFINGDEVRPAENEEYLQILRRCAVHKHRLIDEDIIPPAMHEVMLAWEQRNITQFATPRVSGDDCHETIDDQLTWLRLCGFGRAECTWQRELWAVMVANKR